MSRNIQGYRLIAVGGSDLNIPYDPLDMDTLQKNGSKSYNQYHINAAYDILNNRYVDLLIQGRAHSYEQEAMWTAVHMPFLKRAGKRFR